MKTKLEKIMKESCKKAITKIGDYKLPVRTYIAEVILRSGKKGIGIKDIYERLENVGVERKTTKSCLSMMVKDDEVKLFWTPNKNEKTRYKLKTIKYNLENNVIE